MHQFIGLTILVIIVYLMLIPVPKSIVSLFQDCLFKIVFLSFILLMGHKDIQLSILLACLFIIINMKYDNEENFIDMTIDTCKTNQLAFNNLENCAINLNKLENDNELCNSEKDFLPPNSCNNTSLLELKKKINANKMKIKSELCNKDNTVGFLPFTTKYTKSETQELCKNLYNL